MARTSRSVNYLLPDGSSGMLPHLHPSLRARPAREFVEFESVTVQMDGVALTAQVLRLPFGTVGRLLVHGAIVPHDAPVGRHGVVAGRDLLLRRAGHEAQEDAGHERARQIRIVSLGEQI